MYLVANIRLIWYFPSACLHVGCVLLIHGVHKSVISLVQCVYLVANIRLTWNFPSACLHVGCVLLNHGVV